MNKLLGKILYERGIVYLDDIILWADTLEEMEELIDYVVKQMADAGLMLNGEKSNFLTKKLEVLGHWVEAGLLKPDTNKLKWLRTECVNHHEVRSLLGALSYFRKFIPGFSKRMKPVIDLLTADPVEWTDEHERAVKEVMDRLQSDCFLKLPSYDRPFYVHSDYSGVGIGAVLM